MSDRLTEIPGSIYIGPKEYIVKWTQAEWDKEVARDPEDMHDKWGSSDHFEHTIHLKPGQATSEMQDTLLHEVLHCIWAQGQELDRLDERPGEEYLVARMSPWLLMVLQWNPILVSYLMPDHVTVNYNA